MLCLGVGLSLLYWLMMKFSIKTIEKVQPRENLIFSFDPVFNLQSDRGVAALSLAVCAWDNWISLVGLDKSSSDWISHLISLSFNFATSIGIAIWESRSSQKLHQILGKYKVYLETVVLDAEVTVVPTSWYSRKGYFYFFNDLMECCYMDILRWSRLILAGIVWI